MAEILLSSENFIKSVTNISDNVSGKYILASLREAQEIGLKNIIGDCLLEKLKVLIKSGIDAQENLKYKYGNRHFWCRGYYVDTVGKNEKKIAEYIREQLQADIMEDQIGLKEFVDPFTGAKNTKA